MTDARATAAVTRVVGGYDVALDGIIGPWFLDGCWPAPPPAGWR